jgi:hypothetical protein
MLKLPEVDLSPLKRIFPKSNKTHRDALYAHLVCYNYIIDLELRPYFQEQGVPTHTTKIPGNVGDSVYGKLIKGLESCINDIIHCISRNSASMRHMKRGDSPPESSMVIIRSLAKLIRSCEDLIM